MSEVFVDDLRNEFNQSCEMEFSICKNVSIYSKLVQVTEGEAHKKGTGGAYL